METSDPRTENRDPPMATGPIVHAAPMGPRAEGVPPRRFAGEKAAAQATAAGAPGTPRTPEPRETPGPWAKPSNKTGPSPGPSLVPGPGPGPGPSPRPGTGLAKKKSELGIGPFRLLDRAPLGRGAHGTVRVAQGITTGRLVAAKIMQNPKLGGLHVERFAYERLRGTGVVPDIIWDGKAEAWSRIPGPEAKGFELAEAKGTVESTPVTGPWALVTELMGESLHDLWKACGNRFTLPTVLEVGRRLIAALQVIHNHGVLHCDVKPHNVVIGLRGVQRSQLYFVDFGLAQPLFRSSSGEHIRCHHDETFRGTDRYASLHAHQHMTLSRRDDLESLGYSLLCLLGVQLPWHHQLSSDFDRQDREMCRAKSNEQLFRFLASLAKKGQVPGSLVEYMFQVRKLGFDQEPDYEALVALMDRASTEHKAPFKGFDWVRVDLGDVARRRRRAPEDAGQRRLRVLKKVRGRLPHEAEPGVKDRRVARDAAPLPIGTVAPKDAGQPRNLAGGPAVPRAPGTAVTTAAKKASGQGAGGSGSPPMLTVQTPPGSPVVSQATVTPVATMPTTPRTMVATLPDRRPTSAPAKIRSPGAVGPPSPTVGPPVPSESHEFAETKGGPRTGLVASTVQPRIQRAQPVRVVSGSAAVRGSPTGPVHVAAPIPAGPETPRMSTASAPASTTAVAESGTTVPSTVQSTVQSTTSQPRPTRSVPATVSPSMATKGTVGPGAQTGAGSPGPQSSHLDPRSARVLGRPVHDGEQAKPVGPKTEPLGAVPHDVVSLEQTSESLVRVQQPRPRKRRNKLPRSSETRPKRTLMGSVVLGQMETDLETLGTVPSKTSVASDPMTRDDISYRHAEPERPSASHRAKETQTASTAAAAAAGAFEGRTYGYQADRVPMPLSPYIQVGGVRIPVHK